MKTPSKYWDQVLNIIQPIPKPVFSEFSKLSLLQSVGSIFLSWAMIAFGFALVVFFPNPLVLIFSLILIGGRQLALAILMHEAAHKLLCKTFRWNDFWGQWFCAYPVWGDLKRYRPQHLEHHRYTGEEQDPDIGLVLPYPTSKKRLLKRFVRDLLGITGVKRIYGLLLMDMGFITYTASTGSTRIDTSQRSWREFLSTSWRNLHGVLMTNLILFSILSATGYPILYGVWVLAYLTTYSLFIRVRAISEHAATPNRMNALENTRSLNAGLLSRITVAPHHVNYHLEHHLLMSVPHYRLPKWRSYLKNAGILKNTKHTNYLHALKEASN